MKPIKSIFLAIVPFLVACTHEFEGYNTNPNEMPVGNVTPDALLEDLVATAATTAQNYSYSLNGELIQYSVTGSSLEAYHRYVIPASMTNNQWAFCSKWASNADHMYDLALKAGDANYQAIALTLRAFYVSNLTDIYGYIPFTEAFSIREGISKPKFDDQKTIYTQLFDDLEKANALYKTADLLDSPEKDRLYAGDTRKWQKFTNSLHLRLLMRLTNRAKEMDIAARVRKIVEAPTTYPVFTSNEDNATVFFSGISPFENPFGARTDSQFNARRPAEYFIEYLDDTRDPRLYVFFTPGGGGYVGRPSGVPTLETTEVSAGYFNIEFFRSYVLPYSYMKCDEVYFILAEAAFRGYIDGDPAEYYYKGIDRSIDHWVYVNNDIVGSKNKVSVTDEVLQDFHANVEYENTLECIMNQKYVALFFAGYEAWHEYRRTGFPRLKIGSGTFNDGVLPTRLVYPVNTSATNGENYAKVVAEMAADYVRGADDMQTPVWWSAAALEKGRR